MRDWSHQDNCVMCNRPLETGVHLCLFCPLVKSVWTQVLTWEHFNVQLIQHDVDPSEIISWWEAAAQKVPKYQRRRFNGMIIYILWNLWKERNCRIFENRFQTAEQVASRAKENIEMRKRALTTPGYPLISCLCFFFIRN
jgi:hypothetical protein